MANIGRYLVMLWKFWAAFWAASLEMTNCFSTMGATLTLPLTLIKS